VVRFVGKHALLCAPAAAPLLPPDLLNPGSFGIDVTLEARFDFIEQ
jgi:hypothetical protein